MAGKWLIFWCSLSLKRSWASIWESIHITSHFSDFFDLSTSHPSSLATVSTTSYCVSSYKTITTGDVYDDDLGINFLDLIFFESWNDWGDLLCFFWTDLWSMLFVFLRIRWLTLRFTIWIFKRIFHLPNYYN